MGVDGRLQHNHNVINIDVPRIKLNTRNKKVELNIMYQNVRGLRTKTRECFISSQCDSIEAYMISETWLNDSFNNNEIFSSHFNIFRSDNVPSLSTKSRGGGVLIAVNEKFKIIKEAVQYNTKLTDAVCVYANIYDSKFLLCCIYVSPSCSENEYTKLYDFLLAIIDALDCGYKIFISGDFNLPSYVHEFESRATAMRSNSVNGFLNFLDQSQLKQFNLIKNQSGRILDLVLSNLPTSVTHSFVALVKEDSHHPSLLCSVERPGVHKNLLANNITCNFDFLKADPGLLRDALEVLDLHSFYELTDANLACEYFYERLNVAFERCVPKKISVLNPKFPNYFTKRIIERIKLKNLVYKKISKANHPLRDDVEKFKHLRKSIKKDIKKAYARHANLCETMVTQDPKKIWKFTADRLDKKQSSPSSIIFNGTLYANPKDIADQFAKYFQTVYAQEEDDDLLLENIFRSNFQTLSINNITTEEVNDALDKVKNTSSAGPDGIPNFIVARYANVFSKPLKFLFNLSLKQMVYPQKWKLSRVCPIFKKGDKNKGENYRAVSVLSCFSKVFETILFNRLLSSVKNIIIPEQHGFFKGRSTESNLSVFTNYVAKSLAQKKQVDTIYFDFKSAFDLVNHSILMLKLTQYDIPPYLILLLKSYLSNRFQFVAFRGFQSEPFAVHSGVPQGSNLAPLLFIIFINDLITFLRWASALVYADDLKIYRAITSLEDCELMQNDIDAIAEWAILNKMVLHSGKCEIMRFSRGNKIKYNYILNGSSLKSSVQVKDLGVTFRDNLSFNDHIANMVAQASRKLGFIIRICYHFRNVSTFKLLYFALVRSKLEYGCTVWNPQSDSQSLIIERIQKRFLRYMYFRSHNIYPHFSRHPVSTVAMLSEFNMVSLKVRRDVIDCMVLVKILHGAIDCSALLHDIGFRVYRHNTRHRQLFAEGACLGHPLERWVCLMNRFDTDPFRASIPKLKQSLYDRFSQR